MNVQCCKCKKFKIKNGKWIHNETLEESYGLELSHGFCPDCYKEEMQKIERRKRRKQNGI